MRAIFSIPFVLHVVLASPFTFSSQPYQRHVTLTAQDGRPLVLTIAQTITRKATTTLTPPTLIGSPGPRRTGRPEGDQLELRVVFAPTGSSGSAGSASTSPASSPASEDGDSDSDSDTNSDSSSNTDMDIDTSSDSNSESSETETSVEQNAAAAQTTPAPPTNDPAVAAALAEQGYSQATYYTCLTRDATYTHCGWHVPVVKVSAAAKDDGGSQRLGVVALGVACAIAVGNLQFGS